MSLTRRLQLALALLLLLALAANLFLQLQRTRDFLALQLQSHAQDTATSLALSLSPALTSGDKVRAERMIDAVFDRGYYRRIVWLDVDEAPLLSREAAPIPAQVPAWFSGWLPIHSPQAGALLSGGWSQYGKLVVESHTGYAQLALWRSFVDLLTGSLLAMIALGLLVVYMVQRALAPLHRMADAAHQFVSRRAPMQLPSTVVSELQPLALALGQMSQQVAAQFAAQASQLTDVQQQLQTDSVTGLPNRLALLHRLSEAEHQSQPLALIALRLDNLATVNAERGYAGTNAALQTLVGHLRDADIGHWCRLSGSEFVALLGSTETPASSAPNWLSLPSPWQAVAVQSLAAADTNPGAILSHIDAALNEAQQRKRAWWPLAVGEMLPAEAWRERLQGAIARPSFQFLPARIEALTTRAQMATEWLARLPQASGPALTAGQLLAQARRLSLETELEAALLQRLSEQPVADRPVHINISARALSTPPLRQLLTQLARGRQLSFELSESEALQLPNLPELIQPLRAEGIGFGLDQVALSAGLLAVLPRWRPDYLKLGLGLAEAGPESPLITAVTRLAQGLDIAVLVPVAQNEPVARWQHTGIDGLVYPPSI